MKVEIPTRDIDYILDNNCIVVDVRSESEYKEFNIPNSINIPIFNDHEREYIGTLYKQESIDRAMEEGLKISALKLHNFYMRINQLLNNNEEIIITCHRGGMRSRTIVLTMLLMNLPVKQLDGGIKSFRTKISNTFDFLKKSDYKFLVIEGMTGTSKTKLIVDLEKKGYPTINLEKYAKNRGSIFGHVGLTPTSQKQFEVELYMRYREISEASFFIIEAESKRIGNVIVPDWILLGKESGERLKISTTIHKRALNIIEDYNYEENKLSLNEAYNKLKKRLPSEIIKLADHALNCGEIVDFVKLLLSEYYDPRYEFTSNKYETSTLNIDYINYEELVKKTEQLILNKFYSKTY
ncbi:MAG: hypothetical protein K0S51_760 [Bacillales bacterium]|jgi:tRNA 2-selenouridine synthase|nr:hypothetical protein [Bacillales bacterium]